MDAVQLDFFADDPNNRPMLLSSLGEGIQNDCGVYTKNVLEFREGRLKAVLYSPSPSFSSPKFFTNNRGKANET